MIMSEEKCPECKELKTACKCKKDDNIKDIKVTVDTGNIESILKRLSDEEAKSKKLSQELEETKKLQSTTALDLESTKKKEKEYEDSLKKIGEEKLNVQRQIIIDKAKEVIKDPEQIKKIEESVKDPESLRAVTTLVDGVYNAIKQGSKEHEEILKKEREEFEKKLKENNTNLSGTIPMTDEMKQKELNRIANTKGYDSHPDMIRDIRKRQHSDNPEERAKANTEADELLKRWTSAVKRNFDGKVPITEFGPKDIKDQPSLRTITKKGGEAI
jgi:hypothetical protein